MSPTAVIFALLFASGLGLAIFRHPVFGLYTYVAVFYLHPPSRWWAAGLPDLRWSFTAALVTFLATLALRKDSKDGERQPWWSTTPAKLLIAYTAWLWIQSPWALAPEDHMYMSTLYVKYIVVFYLVYRLLDTRERVVEFLLCHLAGCLYLGWVALNANFSGRLNGVGGPGIDEANLLAAQLATAVVIGAMLLLSERGWRWWLTAASLPLAMNTMVMAGSRGAFLSVLVAGGVLWYLKPKTYRRAFYGYAALGLIAFLGLAHEEFWSRMTTITAAAESYETADESAQNRMEGFKAQLQMAKSYPHGSGHRGTAVLSPDYMDAKWLTGNPPQRSSHNTFMTALVEQGIPGVFFFLGFLLYITRTLLARRRAPPTTANAQLNSIFAAIGGGLAVVYVAGNFVDCVKAEIYIWLLGALAALAEVARRQQIAEPVRVEAAARRDPAAMRGPSGGMKPASARNLRTPQERSIPDSR